MEETLYISNFGEKALFQQISLSKCIAGNCFQPFQVAEKVSKLLEKKPFGHRKTVTIVKCAVKVGHPQKKNMCVFKCFFVYRKYILLKVL